MSHDTPHRDYTTATTKCSVCHAVHKAPSDGELLLRDTVAESCVYCHIDSFVGGIRIYDGKSSLYYDDNKKNHSRAGGAPCGGCHSVHGANTYGTELETKILKRLTIQPELVRLFSEASNPEVLYEAVANDGDYMMPAPPYDYAEWNTPRNVQQTAFCTGCHPYYTRNDTVAGVTDLITVGGTKYASHPMKRKWDYGADDAAERLTGFDSPGSTVPTSTLTTRRGTNGCKYCHGEGDDIWLDAPAGVTQGSSFPHYTETQERFLVSGDGYGTTIDETPDSRQDGTCLLCHRWGDISAPEGVGATY
jgi:predicted CXXCH cytochrome family protein